MTKDVRFDKEARESIKRGVDKLTQAVSMTLGARGMNVICTDFLGQPFITMDGTTVADDFELEDPLENAAAELLKQAASNTNKEAGDGTTTATVLAHAIIEEGYKNIAVGANAVLLKRGIDLATEVAVAHLKDISVAVTPKGLSSVATISANNDVEIGALIAEAYSKVGQDGVVVVKDSPSPKTYTELAEGMTFDSGYISPYFVNDQKKGEVNMKNAVVVIVDEILSNDIQILRIISPIMESQRLVGKDIFIIAEDVEAQALRTLVGNNLKSPMNIAAVKAPKYGFAKIDFLKDLAAISGSKVIAQDVGDSLATIDESFFGVVDTIKITEATTSISINVKDRTNIKERIDIVKAKIESSQSESEKDALRDRLSKLSDGVATIMVGATSSLESKEKLFRVEDAVNSTRAAIEEGIVEGGGVALLRTHLFLKSLPLPLQENDVQLGWKILIQALLSPITAIVTNGGGISASIVIDKIIKSKKPIGFDVRKEKFVNMLSSGIIDPKKVTRCALENAASIGGMILTVNCALVDKGSKILDKNTENYKTSLI